MLLPGNPKLQFWIAYVGLVSVLQSTEKKLRKYHYLEYHYSGKCLKEPGNFVKVFWRLKVIDFWVYLGKSWNVIDDIND